jgi:serine O-acetyltransferase
MIIPYQKLFSLDCYRKLGKYKANSKDLFLNRDLKCIYVFRKAHYYCEKKKKLLALIWRIKLRKLTNKYDFNIPASTTIGRGFFIGHNAPIIINREAVIGDNCNIATGVTIGVENRGARKGAPILGNRVWVGTNAVIVGHISIGNNVLIAPNSFVNFNVPDNSIVIGNPGKIISKEDAVKDYICNEV